MHPKAIAATNPPGVIRELPKSVMDEAIYATEERFLSVVKNGYQGNSDLTRSGTCCICCYMWRNEWLYVSNLGDSRAVLGSRRGVSTYARELVSVHNCNIGEKFRNGLRNWHSDPRFVVEERNAWRVKGVSKISRSIGDAYLKYQPNFIGAMVSRLNIRCSQ